MPSEPFTLQDQDPAKRRLVLRLALLMAAAALGCVMLIASGAGAP